ncbi:MAG: hypothetical protein ABII09_11955 [Planctomycetota bacterium]
MLTKMTEIRQKSAQQVPAEELYGLPVDTAVLFSDHKGRYNRRVEKYQRKLIAKLGPIAPFLGRSEKILFAFTGCSHASLVEQLLTGAFLQPLKRSLFVATDRRILHIPTAINRSYRCSIAQIMYTDCLQLRMRCSTLTAKYKSGRTEKFRCIDRKNRKKIKAFLKNMSLEGRASMALERTPLCPECTRPLIKNYYACPHCSLKFKKKSWATVLSILFPGGGFFYTRHPLLGLLDAAMEILFAILLVLVSITFFMSQRADRSRLGQAIVVCSVVLVFKKLSAILFSSKCVEEFIPKPRHVDVIIDQTPAHSSQPEPEDALATGWRSR